MEQATLQVNGCGVIDREDLVEIQQELFEMKFELLEEDSPEQLREKVEALREQGFQFLKGRELPEIFLIKVSCFETGSDVEQFDDPDEVLLVGLEVVRRDPKYTRCGLVVFGRKVYYEPAYGVVLMSCLCKTESTLFEYIIPTESKVFEVRLEDCGMVVEVTCPEVIKDFVLRCPFFIDAINPSTRFFATEDENTK